MIKLEQTGAGFTLTVSHEGSLDNIYLTSDDLLDLILVIKKDVTDANVAKGEVDKSIIS